MALYRGNAHWMYQQLKRHYIEIYRSEKGLISFANFKLKLENGIEFWFLGDSYKLNKEDSSTGIDKFKNFIRS